MKKIEKIKNIISITCLIATLDICIVPWIGLAIENVKISKLLCNIGFAGAIAITISMFAGLILTIVEDKMKNK